MDQKIDVASYLRPAVLPEIKNKVLAVGPIREKFVPPVPQRWIIAANKIATKRHSPAPLFVGLILWQRLRMRKRQPLRITKAVWSEFESSRVAVRRAPQSIGGRRVNNREAIQAQVAGNNDRNGGSVARQRLRLLVT